MGIRLMAYPTKTAMGKTIMFNKFSKFIDEKTGNYKFMEIIILKVVWSSFRKIWRKLHGLILNSREQTKFKAKLETKQYEFAIEILPGG